MTTIPFRAAAGDRSYVPKPEPVPVDWWPILGMSESLAAIAAGLFVIVWAACLACSAVTGVS